MRKGTFFYYNCNSNCNSGKILHLRNEKTPAFTEVSTILYGGGIEAHRLLSAPLTLSANVFTSLPRSQFTVNGSKMSTILSTEL